MLQALQQGGRDTKTRRRRENSPSSRGETVATGASTPHPSSAAATLTLGVLAFSRWCIFEGQLKKLSPVFSRQLIGCGILRPVAKTFSWSLVGFHKWKPQEVCRCILTLLYFVLGVTEGQKKQTQEAPVDSWLGMDKERVQVDGQKA